jgi:hypothetical protein
MMPLTAATHFIEWSDIHRADADLAGKNDRVPFWRQRNLEMGQAKKSCASLEQSWHKVISRH